MQLRAFGLVATLISLFLTLSTMSIAKAAEDENSDKNAIIAAAIDRAGYSSGAWCKDLMTRYGSLFVLGKTNMEDIREVFKDTTKDYPWTLKGTNVKVRILLYANNNFSMIHGRQRATMLFVFPPDSKTLTGYGCMNQGSGAMAKMISVIPNREIVDWVKRLDK